MTISGRRYKHFFFGIWLRYGARYGFPLGEAIGLLLDRSGVFLGIRILSFFGY